MPKFRLTGFNYTVAAGVGVLASTAIIVRFAQSERRVPARCPSGLEAQEARCCGVGQGLSSSGQCAGSATGCAEDMVRDDSGACVLPQARIQLPGGTTRVGAVDWEGPTQPVQDVTVGPFDLDRGEVSVDRFRECSAASRCPKISDESEPGRPVRNVSPEEAAQFCAFAGGRLPTSEEWLFAATGISGRRYPWGNTGLVCRRATFGLVVGPCARAGTGPDFVGARPNGATPEGVQDLAGNVAEWTIERDGSFVARGGSYRSEAAGDLKSWSFEPRQTRAAHVGFRCAYDGTSASNANAGK